MEVIGSDGESYAIDNTEPVSKGNKAVCYDARGNGNGNIAPTITGDHQNRITDYTAIVVLPTENGDLYGK